MKNNIFIYKFSNVFISRGFNRSLVVDCLRGEFYYIPNELVDFVDNYDGKELTENEQEIYEDFISYLLDNELAFISKRDRGEMFISFSESWDYPSIISNAIIELNENNNSTCFKSIELLSELGCSNFLFFSNFKLSPESIDYMLTTLKGRLIDTIDLYIQYSEDLIKWSEKTIECNPNIRSIILFNSPQDDFILSSRPNRMGKLFTVKHHLDFNSCDKKVSGFNLTLDHYLEGDKHHTFFNRKIFINGDGDIKNAPNTNESFGKMGEINDLKALKKIVINPAFQKYWKIAKNSCDICDVCEYRRICIDNRVPLIRNDRFYFESECNYNPFISCWKGDIKYKSLKEMDVVSNSQEYAIDEAKIRKYNIEIWN